MPVVISAVSDALCALRADLTIDRARIAARSGDLDEALRLLQGLDTAETANAAVLDLMARVHAQRAEFSEADACWSRVQQGASDSSDAEAGRHAIAGITAGRRPVLAPLRPGRIALVAVTLFAALLAGTLVWPGSDAGPSTGGRAPAASLLKQQTARVEALEKQLRAISSLQTQAAASRARTLEEAGARLRVPGVQIRRKGESLSLTFTTGLFLPDSVEPTPHGTMLLDEIGRRLPKGNVVITVIGHAVAVPGGPAHGGSMVALTRAQVAAQRLAAAGRLPLTAFALATADQRDGPYPDNRRNRTVTLLITPLQAGPG